MVNWLDTNISFEGALSNNGRCIIDDLIKEANCNDNGYAGGKYFFDETDILNVEWLREVAHKGLIPYVANVFVRNHDMDPPYPHDDGPGTYAALNWVSCSSPQEMVWYESSLEPAAPVNVKETGTYISYDVDSLTQIDSKCIEGDKMTLVRTDIPHDVLISGNNLRVSVSVRFRNGWNSWEDAVQFFKERNL